MNDESFCIHLTEINGFKTWEMEDIPLPHSVSSGNAKYNGQKYVEQLLKAINRKAFMEHDESYIAPFLSIYESCLEQGVENESMIHWDDKSFYTRISWTGYTWKLPPELKRRMVKVEISKLGSDEQEAQIRIPLKKIADDGGDILLSPRMVSKQNLRSGNTVKVKIRFCN